MLSEVPVRSLFAFELPLHYRAKLPPRDGTASGWNAKYLLPSLVELDDAAPFADVYACWNDEVLAFCVDVPERRGGLNCDPDHWWKGDGFRICLDTRDARTVKRATRYCHFIYVLPTGGGPRKHQPIVGTHRMSRAKEPPPAIDADAIRVQAHVTQRRYSFEVHVPTRVLTGWAPHEHPRCGIFYKLKDLEHGGQHLTVPDELGWNADPSTWATGLLER